MPSNLKDKFLKARTTGQAITVVFIKKDGTIRRLTGRGGVTAYLTGAGLSFVPEDKGMSTLFEIPRCPHCGRFVRYEKTQRQHTCGGTLPANLGGYRMITWDRIVSVKIGGVTYD